MYAYTNYDSPQWYDIAHLSISGRGFAFGFPKKLYTNGDVC